MLLLDFLIVPLSNRDGVCLACSYFRCSSISALSLMMQVILMNNNVGLTTCCPHTLMIFLAPLIDVTQSFQLSFMSGQLLPQITMAAAEPISNAVVIDSCICNDSNGGWNHIIMLTISKWGMVSEPFQKDDTVRLVMRSIAITKILVSLRCFPIYPQLSLPEHHRWECLMVGYVPKPSVSCLICHDLWSFFLISSVTLWLARWSRPVKENMTKARLSLMLFICCCRREN